MEFDNYSKDERYRIGSSSSERQTVNTEKAALSGYMTSVYKMMCYALVLTGAAAWVIGHNEKLFFSIFSNVSYWIFALAELGLVFAISAGIQKFEAKTLNILFVIFSILNGITLSSIFLVYKLPTISTAFFVTAGTFGACSFVGATIKKDLSFVGQIAMYALIGCLIATVVNYFVASSTFDWILTYVMLGIFLILTAWDTQKLRMGGFHLLAEEDQSRWVVFGALQLYLDFINLFVLILRVLGRSRD